MFGKVKATTLQEQILNKLKVLIQNGSLKAGQFLPAERELAESLGVSRIPLREALNKLQALGVIEIQHGKKSLIKGLGGIPIAEIIEMITVNGDELEIIDQLTESRLILEVEIACLASQRRTENDLKKMESLIDQMEKESDDSIRMQELSLEFHLSIAEASKNRVLFLTSLFFYDLHRRSREYSKRIVHDALGVVKDHKEIFEAINNKDCDLARKMMKEHLATERLIQMGMISIQEKPFSD